MFPRLAAAFIGLVTLGAAALALLPDEMHVSRTAVVRADATTITHYVSHYPKRLEWVAWTEIDPAADYTFAGEPGQPGATMAWIGAEIGTAELTLDHVVPGRSIDGTLVYRAPFAMTSTDRFDLEPLDDGRTRVTWSTKAPLPYGPSRLFGLVADRLIGPDYARGLEKLDALLATRS
jgi:hypothetical protein